MATDVQQYGTAVRVVHEPGNGTRYEAIGIRVPHGVPTHGDAWLVAFPLLGVAHFFYPESFTSVSYVAEKLAWQRNGVTVCAADIHEMTKCITTIIGGDNNATTNDAGRFPAVP